MRLILSALFVLLVAGCISPARKLDPSAIQLIKKGENRSEIEHQFGKPGDVIVGSNQKTVAEYSYAISAPSGLRYEFEFRSLSVLYDKHDRVEKWAHHQSNRTLDGNIAGRSIGTPLLQQPDWIKKGRTTLKEVVQLQGPPDFKTFTPDGNLVAGWIYAKHQRGSVSPAASQRFLLLVDDEGLIRDFQVRAGTVR